MALDLISLSEISPIVSSRQAANQQAARFINADYRSRKAKNIVRQQDADRALFAEYL